MPTTIPPLTGTGHRVRSYDGTDLSAVVAGDGMPLVLAHGALVSSAAWAPVWRALLPAGHRLIAYDLRGHGGSSLGSDGFGTTQFGRDLACVLEHFDIRGGVLVAHSAGAIGALALAADKPCVLSGRLRGMVLASASPRGIGDSLQNRLLAPIVFSGLIGRVLRRPRPGRAFARTLFGDRPNPQQVELARRMMAAAPAHTQAQAPRAVLDYDFSGRLHDVGVPALLVHGDRDRNVTAAHSRALLEELPHARMIRYAGAGHFLILERAERFAEDVNGFLRGES